MADLHNASGTPLFIQPDVDEEVDESAMPSFTAPALSGQASPNTSKGKQPFVGESLAPNTGAGGSESSTPTPQLSGTIGSPLGAAGAARGGGARGQRSTVAGVRVETRYSGGNTLDEPVSTTILRDLTSIYHKLVQVLYPIRKGDGREVLRDWDLWGPLILCLFLGILLSLNAAPSQSLPVFTGVVVIISVGSLVVTVQAKLLGGRVSFFQALCVLGYCVAPLDIAALVSTFVHVIWVRVPVTILAWAWCIWASMNFLDGTKIESQRVLLAVYPLLLFYFILAWMIIIQ